MPENQNFEVGRPLWATSEAAVLRQFFRFIFGNFFILAAGVAIGVFLGFTAQHLLPVTYEADGSFVVDELPFLQASSEKANLDGLTQGDLVQSLILGIPSLNMQSAIATRLGVPEKQICFEDIAPRPLSLKSPQPVANIRISSARDSRTGTITVTSQSAAFAAQAANALLDELNNYNLAQGKLNALSLDMQFASSRAQTIQSQLAQLEQLLELQQQQVAQLDEYVKEKLPLESFPGFATDTPLNNLIDQRLLAQSDYDALNASSSGEAQLDAYLKKKLPLESFPGFATDTTLNNLKTERLLAQSDYDALNMSSPGGVQLESKKAQVADIDGQIKQQAESLAEGIRLQLESKKTRVTDLDKQVKQQAESLAEGIRAQLAGTKVQEQSLDSELRDAQQKIQLLNHEKANWVQSFGDIAVMKKMIAGEDGDQIQSGSAIIVVSRAFPAERPKSPKLWLNLIVGILVGGTLGLTVALMRAMLWVPKKARLG